MKQETITNIRGLINKGSSGSEIVVFPNADYGFNADYRPSYDSAVAMYAQKLARTQFKSAQHSGRLQPAATFQWVD